MANPFEIRLRRIEQQEEEVDRLIKSIKTNIDEIEGTTSVIIDFQLIDELLIYFEETNFALELTKRTRRPLKVLEKLKTQYQSNYINLTTYLTTLRNIESRMRVLKRTIHKNHPLCITFDMVFDESKKIIKTLVTQMFDSVDKVFDYTDLESLESLVDEKFFIVLQRAVALHNYQLKRVITFYLYPNADEESRQPLYDVILAAFGRIWNAINAILIHPVPTGGPTTSRSDYEYEYEYEYEGGLKRRRSKFSSYKHYLKTFKTYSKRKFQTFRKRRNYKKTTCRKH